MLSKPVARSSRGLSSPEAQKTEPLSRTQSLSIEASRAPSPARTCHLLPGHHVELVVAEGVVEGVREVQPADVSVPGEAHVFRRHLVRDGPSDRRRAHQEAVRVVVEIRVVLAPVDSCRRSCSRGSGSPGGRRCAMATFCSRFSKVLSSLLVSFSRRSNQAALYCQRLLVSVAEEARPEVGVAEDQAAEVRDEGLDARRAPRRSRSVGESVASFTSPKASSREKSCASPRLALAHVHVDEVPLLEPQVVEVEGRRWP